MDIRIDSTGESIVEALHIADYMDSTKKFLLSEGGAGREKGDTLQPPAARNAKPRFSPISM